MSERRDLHSGGDTDLFLHACQRVSCHGFYVHEVAQPIVCARPLKDKAGGKSRQVTAQSTPTLSGSASATLGSHVNQPQVGCLAATSLFWGKKKYTYEFTQHRKTFSTLIGLLFLRTDAQFDERAASISSRTP